jgi:uncharacterized protein YggE
MSGFQSWADDKRIKTLVMLVLILTVVALGSYSYVTYKQSQTTLPGQNSISVAGKGEIFAKPDIATFTFSVEADAPDATAAQKKSADAMNAIVAYLKESGVADKDVKTSDYSLNPKYRFEQVTCIQAYNCPPGKQILDGYTVSQSVTVKVRDTAKAGDLISNVGAKGATNISGLAFTIDDIEKLKRDARELAIKDARSNAEKLASDLGVSLGRIVTYSEDQGGGYPPIMYDKAMSMTSGARAMPEAAPSVPTGENTITSNVSIVYELR